MSVPRDERVEGPVNCFDAEAEATTELPLISFEALAHVLPPCFWAYGEQVGPMRQLAPVGARYAEHEAKHAATWGECRRTNAAQFLTDHEDRERDAFAEIVAPRLFLDCNAFLVLVERIDSANNRAVLGGEGGMGGVRSGRIDRGSHHSMNYRGERDG